MINKYKSTGLVLAILLSTSAAEAAPKGFYAGVGLGASSIDYSFDELTDVSLKAVAGYQVNKYFAVEGGLTSFGEVVAGNSDINVTGYEASVLGFIPFSPKFSAFARLGYWKWELNLPADGVIYSEKGDSETFAGLGIEYTANQKYRLRLEANKYDIGIREATTINASVAFRF